jgi:deoxyribonuclease IV
MHKFGLKLWSNNRIYLNEAKRLFNGGIYQYVEIYIVPGSYKDNIAMWKELKAPYIIHAPHSFNNVNLAIKDKRKENAELLEDTFKFANELNTEYIIFHAGTSGDTKEAADQLKALNDKRALIENKPYKALDLKRICNGNSPEEIEYVMKAANIGFCLDIGHAISSANSHDIDPIIYIERFLALKPKMIHFTDGDYTAELDRHGHFGDGDYPIKKIMKMLPKDIMITIESVKGSDFKLDDFENDVKVLKGSL